MNLERNSEERSQRSLSPEASWSVRTYLEAVKEEYTARFGGESDFKFRRRAGADIRVTKVPKREGELPMVVYLVGAGDMFGNWDLDDGFELCDAPDGSWETVVILEMDRRYDCVIVAVYEDSQGVQIEVMDNKPIHNFIVNEGRKEDSFPGNPDGYDSWNVDLEWTL